VREAGERRCLSDAASPHISQTNGGHSVWSPGFSRSDAASPGVCQCFEPSSRDNTVPAKAGTPYTAPSPRLLSQPCAYSFPYEISRLGFPVLHPEGMGENSPGFQPWDFGPGEPSPEGTADYCGLSRPFGTNPRSRASPGLLGYSHLSLWDNELAGFCEASLGANPTPVISHP